MSARNLLLAFVCLSNAVGCGSCGATSSVDAAPDSASAATSSLGVIEGVVRLAEGASLPRYTPEQLGRRPGQPPRPDACPPALESDREPVTRTADGLLVGVMVAATGDADAFARDLPPREPQVQEVHIEGCRLTPRLLVAVRGDTLRVINSDDYPFLPTLGETPFLRALTQGQHRDFELDRGGVRSLGCAFAAPCGRTEIVVVYHPVFAVTGEAGHFRMENVPVGDGLVLHAWHPLFEEARASVDVRAGQVAHVELVLRPTPPPDAPTPAAPNP
ncbi:MAG: hypothetical protein GXP55_18140, partial [Deltaproteobacteria bacterium]|nr:hypothetical protein [Deltaproteobacteria bacterium]